MSKISTILTCKKELLNIYNHAIESIKPERLVGEALSIENNLLSVKSRVQKQISFRIDLKDYNIHVIGGGKSTIGMACGLATTAKSAGVTHLFSHGILSVPCGLRSTLEGNSKERDLLRSIATYCIFGSKNNLPDEDSLAASKTILAEVKKASDRDLSLGRKPLFIVLLSGGGSACLTYPKYIDLEKKLELIKFLVQKGADIVELNKVRRFYSHIKGGQLARHILASHPEARILTLILSDVIGDSIEFIASGPTDVSSSSEGSLFEKLVYEILNKYGYTGELPQISDTSRHSEVNLERVNNTIIGNNMIAVDAAINRAKSLDYSILCLGNELHGSSESIVDHILVKGEECFMRISCSKKLLVIGAGEAVISKLEGESWGTGGRAQEMALDYMISKLSDEARVVDEQVVDIFLAGSTDGQDGPTDVAACLASYQEWSDIEENKFNLEDVLKAKHLHNSYDFWNKFKPDWLIKTGLTGTNTMDLYVYVLANEIKA